MTWGLDHPWLAAASLGAALLVLLLHGWRQRRRATRLGLLGSPGVLARLLPGGDPVVAGGWRAAGLVAALGVALAGPRWGTPPTVTSADGVDLVVAVDASLSMLARDEVPDRLTRARQEVQRLVAAARGDRIGLIAFAGRSYVLSPLTTDVAALALYLDHLDPSIVGEPGSSLAATLRQGRELLAGGGDGGRALVLLTDGESFDEREPMLAEARALRAAGVALVLVGFGTEAGATIPVEEEGLVVAKRDADGVEVRSRYDGALLAAIAREAGGTLIEAGAGDQAARVRAALTGLERRQRETAARQRVPLRYEPFLLLALGCWGAMLWPRRRRPRGALLLLALLAWPDAGEAQTPEARRADAALRAGRPIDAARAWREALGRGDRRPEVLYNLGTAYLAADSLDQAVEVLERLVTAPAGGVVADAWYNLGLAYLRRGLASRSEEGQGSLRNALRAYRHVLVRAPTDTAARFNYELALAALSTRGGGGGGGGRGGGGGDDARDRSPAAMSASQAERLLEAAAREEREVRARQRPTRPSAPARGRDW